jgi:hypothetical protein
MVQFLSLQLRIARLLAIPFGERKRNIPIRGLIQGGLKIDLGVDGTKRVNG